MLHLVVSACELHLAVLTCESHTYLCMVPSYPSCTAKRAASIIGGVHRGVGLVIAELSTTLVWSALHCTGSTCVAKSS